MTRAVARQYGPKKVRAVAICPGAIDTPLTKRTREARSERDARPLTFPIMLDRLGRPEEVADVALFLASDDASYITAAVFPVDGGRTAM
jgi:NAD(P)-dependent dehydrogenase (short-subunit alcohol dehydrogenase family)